MTPERKRRLENVVGLVSGFAACMDAVREQNIFWPPDVFWAGLRNVHRVELGGGLLLIVVVIFKMAIEKKRLT